ncbi:MAG: endonuclease domain-containing protein [Candidatus Bipolaricaulia bacterium]
MSRIPEYRRRLTRLLRQNMTETEKLLWQHLRNRQLCGLKFRRQRPLGRYIADFCCDEAKLIIEVEGSVHDLPEQRLYDQIRAQELAAHGYGILRFRVETIQHQLPKVLEEIKRTALERLRSF